METLHSVIESFILHTNQHTCIFSAAHFPLSFLLFFFCSDQKNYKAFRKMFWEHSESIGGQKKLPQALGWAELI
jgi:hypothetical protein